MHLGKLLHTPNGKIVMSIILGFGLATLFRSVCRGKNCIVLHAPPMNEISNKIYSHQDKCYKFSSEVTKCVAGKKTVEQ